MSVTRREGAHDKDSEDARVPHFEAGARLKPSQCGRARGEEVAPLFGAVCKEGGQCRRHRVFGEAHRLRENEGCERNFGKIRVGEDSGDMLARKEEGAKGVQGDAAHGMANPDEFALGKVDTYARV